MLPKLLLVSAPKRVRKLLSLLHGEAIEVESATGLEQAAEKLGRPTRYDLLLVDTDLKDGSWPDLLKLAKESGSGCEMVVCSRNGDPHLWAEVIQNGAYDLISEPFEKQALSQIIARALESKYLDRFRDALRVTSAAPIPVIL